MESTLTRRFAQGLVELMEVPLPNHVAKHAKDSMLNAAGVAIGASGKQAVEMVVSHSLDLGATGETAILGRTERLDSLSAAVANGLGAHLDDFDDTHLQTVIHPSAATLAALISTPPEVLGDGERVVKAFALGCEAQLRVGVAMSPEHYDDGWHITGTVGPIGAAVAVGLLLGLDDVGLAHAVGVAASQSLGQREGFGTMIKSFHPGKAAANGVHAALLAARGFTSAANALENPRGYFAVLAPTGYRPETIVDGFGSRWELLANAFKPYPCGVVTHPVIDAAVELHEYVDSPDSVDDIVARVHPLVPELTGNMAPNNGLEAKFSTAHGLAAGLVDGTVGVAQYEDDRVTAADLKAVRAKVRYEVDEQVARDSAYLTIQLKDGSTHRADVDHARGSLERPLTDQELLSKVRALVEPVLEDGAEPLVAAMDQVADGAPLQTLLTAACPREMAE